jgi:intracellular septation protein
MKKIFFDLFPIILFFLAFKLAGSHPDQANAFAHALHYTATDLKQLPILLATAVAIVATMLQIGWVWLRHGKVDTMLWVSLALISILGGATLLFQDPTFIKWKPTVLYWLFAVVLAVSQLLFNKNLIRSMMQQAQLELPESIWIKLNYSWVAFFDLMGVLNLYVANHYSLESWVDFKLFGTTAIMFAFILAQGLALSKYVVHKENE